jgi:hypothetical protein
MLGLPGLQCAYGEICPLWPVDNLRVFSAHSDQIAERPILRFGLIWIESPTLLRSGADMGDRAYKGSVVKIKD